MTGQRYQSVILNLGIIGFFYKFCSLTNPMEQTLSETMLETNTPVDYFDFSSSWYGDYLKLGSNKNMVL